VRFQFFHQKCPFCGNEPKISSKFSIKRAFSLQGTPLDTAIRNTARSVGLAVVQPASSRCSCLWGDAVNVARRTNMPGSDMLCLGIAACLFLGVDIKAHAFQSTRKHAKNSSSSLCRTRGRVEGALISYAMICLHVHRLTVLLALSRLCVQK
jgi:hypothetical protein